MGSRPSLRSSPLVKNGNYSGRGRHSWRPFSFRWPTILQDPPNSAPAESRLIAPVPNPRTLNARLHHEEKVKIPAMAEHFKASQEQMFRHYLATKGTSTDRSIGSGVSNRDGAPRATEHPSLRLPGAPVRCHANNASSPRRIKAQRFLALPGFAPPSRHMQEFPRQSQPSPSTCA